MSNFSHPISLYSLEELVPETEYVDGTEREHWEPILRKVTLAECRQGEKDYYSSYDEAEAANELRIVDSVTGKVYE